MEEGQTEFASIKARDFDGFSTLLQLLACSKTVALLIFTFNINPSVFIGGRLFLLRTPNLQRYETSFLSAPIPSIFQKSNDRIKNENDKQTKQESFFCHQPSLLYRKNKR